MANVRELIRRITEDRKLSLSGISLQIGRNHAYLQQYLKRNVPTELPENVREKLAPLLGVSPEQLRSTASVKDAVSHATFLKVPTPTPNDKVPVMGVAEGGPEGWSLWNGEVVDYVLRPPSLASAPNGYATYVIGNSMEPRYYPGELVYVHPGRPVTPGAFVLVQLHPKAAGEPPRAFIKRFVKKTGVKLVLEQFNPEKTVELPIKDVFTIHKIVGSGE